MGELRTCSRCGTETSEECPSCLAWFETRPDPATMTPDERVAEMKSWKTVEISFDKIHQRIQELVGRPVWTHEIGLNWWGLIEEARNRSGEVDMDKVMDPLMETGKPVVGVVVPNKNKEE
jgi:hypothetical protein